MAERASGVGDARKVVGQSRAAPFQADPAHGPPGLLEAHRQAPPTPWLGPEAARALIERSRPWGYGDEYKDSRERFLARYEQRGFSAKVFRVATQLHALHYISESGRDELRRRPTRRLNLEGTPPSCLRSGYALEERRDALVAPPCPARVTAPHPRAPPWTAVAVSRTDRGRL